MANDVFLPGQPISGSFEVFNGDTAVTGLTAANFTIRLSFDLASSAIAVTITEVGNGRYAYTFTPDQVGYWYILITHATYNARGWDDDFYVTGGGGGAGGSWPMIEDYYEKAVADDERKTIARRRRRMDDEAILFAIALE